MMLSITGLLANKLMTVSPESIPVGAYTHLNYAFAYIDPDSFAVAPMSEGDLGLYSRVTNLKDTNPGLQVWISIGNIYRYPLCKSLRY